MRTRAKSRQAADRRQHLNVNRTKCDGKSRRDPIFVGQPHQAGAVAQAPLAGQKPGRTGAAI